MRDELGEVERPRRTAEGAPREDVAECPRDRPHLAAVLVLGLGGRLLGGHRGRLVDRAPAHLLHEVREPEVVAELRVVLDVCLSLDRVDRAVPGGDRARGRLLLAHPHLVAPVRALHVRAVRALEPELPAHVADLRSARLRMSARRASGFHSLFASVNARTSLDVARTARC